MTANIEEKQGTTNHTETELKQKKQQQQPFSPDVRTMETLQFNANTIH